MKTSHVVKRKSLIRATLAESSFGPPPLQSRSPEIQQLVSQSLYQLIGAFVVRHWRAYIASALMLIGIAVLTVWVPRVVGQAVDGLVAGTLQGAALMRELVSLVIMGA